MSAPESTSPPEDLPPPPGWEAPGGEPPPPRPDLAAVVAALEGLRAMVPRELQDQLGALLREALLTLRALIDFYLERLDRGQRQPEVEDIPIE